MITTVSQCDTESKKLTARTKPCTVERLGVKKVQITLIKGHNRQIRKMMGALGLTVLKLHLVTFMNIDSGTVLFKVGMIEMIIVIMIVTVMEMGMTLILVIVIVIVMSGKQYLILVG
jgi:hypothetical protein